MDILYTFDDNYVPQAAASILSVCENNTEERIVFHVIGKNISDHNREQLTAMVHGKGQQIRWTEMNSFGEMFAFRYDTGSWDDIILARLILDRTLPETMDRVLYLDGDTMVRSSLRDLWETDLTGYALGAVMETTVTRSRKQMLGLADTDGYINSGVLYVNLKYWRENGVSGKLIRFYRENQDRIVAPDQDVLNTVLNGKILFLPFSYNYCNTFTFYPYRALRRIAAPVSHFPEEKEYRAWIRDPVIVHFLGEERPWRIGNRHEYTPEYMRYRAETPWSQVPLEDGWQKYFQWFYLFNRLIRPFPLLRYRIITALIPLMLKRKSGKRKE